MANPTDSIGQSRTALAGRKDCRIIPVRDSQYIMRSDWSPCVTTTESGSCITLTHANCEVKQMELADNAQLSSSLPAHCHRLKGETDDNHRAIELSSWNILLSASIQGTCSVSLSMIFWVRLQVANRWDTICLHLIHFISFEYDLFKLFHLFRASFLPHFKHIARLGEGLRSRVLLSSCVISLSASRGGTVSQFQGPIVPLLPCKML